MFGKVAGAVSLSGAGHRFADEQIPDIVSRMRVAGRAVSRKLGYDPAPE